MEEQKPLSWHHQPAEEVLSSFSVSADGLSSSQIDAALDEYGHNELPQKKGRSAFEIFLAQFSSFLMIILVFAAGASLVLMEWLDATVIMAAILLNVILGFVEEYKADQSLEKLKQFLPQQVKVRRGGEVLMVPSRDVVPGDILLISGGNKITADARLISEQALEVNEAALTGESAPVKKSVEVVAVGATPADQTSMVFAGTIAVAGHAEAVVVGTGAHTEIGRISALVSEVKDEKTPLQQQLDVFAKILGAAVSILALIVFSFGVARGFDVTEMFQIAVALSVSAIPEGLVVGVTVILAVGMQRILKRDALIRRLVASETLGSVSVICMDKTGTLTTGEMTLDEVRIAGEVIDPESDSPELHALRRAVYATNASVISASGTEEGKLSGSPTEIALMRFVLPHVETLQEECETLSELPFDSKRKFAAELVRCEGEKNLFVVGAPDVLLDKCDISDLERGREQAVFEEMTAQGMRVLMVTRRDRADISGEVGEEHVNDLSIIGFVGLRDPLRKEARQAIEEARGAGLRPVMITGDHPQTALAIATQAGLFMEGHRLVTGVELDDMTDQELVQEVEKIDLYARVMPRHKLRIVRAWQERKHSVAMTGDGVNDAPAIKAADIGIALGSGTEVAKETADMVLLKNNFQTIVAAIREGRIIFDNVRKVVVYLLSDSFSEIILVMGALILGLPLPLLPAQILWINLITDGFPSIALTFEPGEKNIMKEPPRKKNARILNGEMKALIFIVGLVTDFLLFAVYFYMLGKNLPIEEIRTFIFLKLGLDSLIYVFAVRKFRSSVVTNNPFENKWLVLAVIAGLGLQLLPLLFVPLRDLFGFTTLSGLQWVIVVLLAFLNLILIEIIKALYNHRRRNKERAL